MRRLAIIALLVASAQPAHAKLTVKCEGQTWAQLAERHQGDKRLAELLAAFNRSSEPTCKEGRFVRLISTVRHEVQRGQTIERIASRFCVAKNAAALIRSHNEIDEQPAGQQELEIPAEIELTLTTSWAETMKRLAGLVDEGALRTYNGMRTEPAIGAVIYVPLFVRPVDDAPPPPTPGVVAEPAPAKSKPPQPELPSPKLVDGATPRVEYVARYRDMSHADHATALGGTYECEMCHGDGDDPATAETCRPCHVRVDPEWGGVRANRHALEFSHRQHLDAESPVQKEYDVDCARCHAPATDGRLERTGGHAVCQRCHNTSEQPPAVSKDCEGCHLKHDRSGRRGAARAMLATHLEGAIRGTNLRFEHESHVGETTCGRCHVGAEHAESIDGIEPMRMADCLDCHRGLERVANDTAEQLDRCRTCHLEMRSTSRPDSAFLVERPVSHTRVFARRHARAASADRGVCAGCHAELVGADGAACDRCHHAMTPSDHTAHWRGPAHGRSAVRQPERCGTCHAEDRCADCHRLAPPDHFPRMTFQRVGHGRAARRSARRCAACHIAEADCARCHNLP